MLEIEESWNKSRGIMLKLDDFRPFRVQDIGNEFFMSIRSLFPALSDYNFINIFIWNEVFPFKWTQYGDCFIMYDEKRDFLTMAVLGIQKSKLTPLETPHEYLRMSDDMIAQGKSGNYYMFPPELIERHGAEFSKYFDIKVEPAFSDYIYSTRKLVELKGPKLQKKKNLTHQFMRANPVYWVQKINEEYFDACNEMVEIWCKQNLNCDDPAIQGEAKAIKKALKYYHQLKLEGIMIFIPSSVNTNNSGQMVAFSIFSELNPEMADIHFEKYDQNIKGAGQIINWETAKYLLPRYHLLNREQDLGLPGLQQAKKSYVPEYLGHSCVLIRKR